MSRSRLALGLGVVVLGAGCLGGEETGETGDATDVGDAGEAGGVPEVEGGSPGDRGETGLLLLQESPEGVVGSYHDDAGAGPRRVELRSERVGEDLVEIELELAPSGLVLWFLIDRASGIMEVDGHGAELGEDREMTAADRRLLLDLSRALDELGPDVRIELSLLRDLASHWSEFPNGMEMQLAIVPSRLRGAASLCGRLSSYVRGTHDGWWEWNGSDRTTLDGVYLSLHGPCRSGDDEDSQTTRWWVGSSWQCPASEPDHSTSIEYAYGSCFGRCGAGCGAGSVFSWSCLDHDVCNRFGHSWSASLPGGHCADEFVAAAAELVSEPHCL